MGCLVRGRASGGRQGTCISLWTSAYVTRIGPPGVERGDAGRGGGGPHSWTGDSPKEFADHPQNYAFAGGMSSATGFGPAALDGLTGPAPPEETIPAPLPSAFGVEDGRHGARETGGERLPRPPHRRACYDSGAPASGSEASACAVSEVLRRVRRQVRVSRMSRSWIISTRLVAPDLGSAVRRAWAASRSRSASARKPCWRI